MMKAMFSEPVLGILEFSQKNKLESYKALNVYLLKYTMLVNTGSMLTCWTGTDGWVGKRRETKRNKTTIVGSHINKQIALDKGIQTSIGALAMEVCLST